METVINEIAFDFTGHEQQVVSIRTDLKLSKADVRQIVLGQTRRRWRRSSIRA